MNSLTAQSNPAISVTKDDQLPYGPQALYVGDVITYIITLTNTENVTLNNISLTDANATMQANSVISSLMSGASATLTATHTITQADIDAGQVSNSAVAEVDYNGTTYSDTSDDTDPSSPTGDDDPTITHIIQTPGLALSLDDQLSYLPQNLGVGDDINYILTVTNSGNVVLNNISVSFDNAVVVGSDLIPSLNPGEAINISATHTVAQADLNAGQVVCQATGTVVWNGQTLTDLSDGDSINMIPDEPTITHLQTSAIDEYWANKIKFYYNNIAGFIYVQSDSLKIYNLKIVNNLGQIQAEMTNQASGIYPVSQLSTGMYLIIIQTDKGSLIKKFIKD